MQLAEFEVKRIAVTRADGSEVTQMVWLDRQQIATVNDWVDRALASVPESERARQWFLAQLNERLLTIPPASEEELQAASAARRGETRAVPSPYLREETGRQQPLSLRERGLG